MSAPDDYLLMSGIQHFCFCRRQWALIHLEQQWSENLRTAEGRLEHTRCHDTAQTERRGDLLITRGMKVVSHRLRLSGDCDVVEFRADPEGIPLQHTEGRWRPMPVEYKHGRAKRTTPTGCSSVRRPWLWKRCWPVISRRPRSSTRKHGGGNSSR